MIRLAALAIFAALAGCSSDQLKQVAFCDVVARRPIMTEYVRVEAVGIFSDHGSVLTHPDCPTLSAQWAASDVFENDVSRHVLREAIDALRFDVSPPTSLDPEELSVDITARYRWRRGRPEFSVEKVHSVRRVPTVYASEFERQFTRCEIGPLVGQPPDEWRAACAASEEWFRAQREANN
jgi:hypothetical protein